MATQFTKNKPAKSLKNLL